MSAQEGEKEGVVRLWVYERGRRDVDFHCAKHILFSLVLFLPPWQHEAF